MTRYVLLAFLCLGASVSRAQGMLPGGAELVWDRTLLHGPTDAEGAPTSDPEELLYYFNAAHCECSLQNYAGTEDPPFFSDTATFELKITMDEASGTIDKEIEIWTGAACNTLDAMTRPAQCFPVANPGVGTVAQVQEKLVVPVNIPILDLVSPAMADRPGCAVHEQDTSVWALVDSNDDGQLDYAPMMPATVHVDTQPPPLPTNFRALGAENAIEISWDPPTDRATDIAYYQALCATTIGMAPAKSSPPEPRYQTGRRLCNFPSDALLTPSEITSNTGTDAGTGSITLNDEMAQLNASYLCGETTSSTAQSMRISGLKNGVEYTVILLAIDKSGNANGTYFTSSLVPQPATDFWEDLHDQGSGVEGGFCLLSQTYGDGNPLTQSLRSFRDNTLADTAYGRWLIDVYYGTVGGIDLHGSLALRIVAGVVLLPLVALALLWHLLTLPGLIALVAIMWMVRRRKLVLARLATASTIAVIALVPMRAHAQSPYWEHNDFTEPEQQELAPGDPERVRWHAGVRLGPYVPGIDAQLDMPIGKYAGPYEQMFGGYSILPMLDIDYFFLRGVGQFGVGASIGYMGKKEHAWQAGSDPMSANRPRAPGDDNKFRLFPLSINAVYRLTYLDDNYGVPIIPYARGGIAYYVWWVTAPNGDFAKSCVGPNTTDTCPKTTAAGASLGVVGSLGLALRAERIDASAARSMRESGIEHAGFYAEYSIGKVDGFGSDKKLSVGAATWFAGVDFEF
jgi:hypothetical protein